MAGLCWVLGGVAAADTALTVMSFNLRYATADDGENAWPHRKDILVRAIERAAPDIIGVQECLGIQAAYIAEKLPEYHWIGIGREDDGGGEMSAIFYRKGKLNPISSDHFWLSETPDVPGSKSWNTACTRMATHVRFWHRETHTFFDCYNTHMDHVSEEARQNGARLIVSRTNLLPRESPAIVTGDFNADAERSVPWQLFADAGFQDAWRVAAERVGPEVTSAGFGPPPSGENSRIDWVLVRGPIRVERCETVVYEENGRYPSDHYPVVARIVIGK